jgi:hypothetical protein
MGAGLPGQFDRDRAPTKARAVLFVAHDAQVMVTTIVGLVLLGLYPPFFAYLVKQIRPASSLA